MADIKKSERIIQLLVELLKRPEKSFSVSELLFALNLPERERRNLQRDVNSLIELPGELVSCEGRGPNKKYHTGLPIIDKLILPDFENVMLQFVFLRNIANIYPGTADLIEKLVEKIQSSLPLVQQDKLRSMYSDFRSRVFFMGAPPKIDDSARDKLDTILQAIRTHHEICTRYTSSDGREEKKYRIPIGIVLFLGEIYVACARHNAPKAIYPLKLSRIDTVKSTNNIFVENAESKEALERQVKDISFFNSQKKDVEKIHLTFPRDKRPFIEEHPYHQSMKIKEHNGILHVTMNVNISLQLRQWLLFHTENGVEIIKPKHLRKSLFKIGKDLTEKYK